MRKTETIKVYNLVGPNGKDLRLELGIIKEGLEDDAPYLSGSDTGFRWCFIGREIPMPVRSGYWFNGFPEAIMLDWLKANGWALRTCVDMYTGKAKVYELPKANEASSETETMDTNQFPALSEIDKPVFERVIRNLVDGGFKARACRVYRYVHGGKLSDALAAVNMIITE